MVIIVLQEYPIYRMNKFQFWLDDKHASAMGRLIAIYRYRSIKL